MIWSLTEWNSLYNKRPVFWSPLYFFILAIANYSIHSFIGNCFSNPGFELLILSLNFQWCTVILGYFTFQLFKWLTHHDYKKMFIPFLQVAGVYEGGLKIWECSLDLATFVATNVNVEKCNVIELGCGAALPAIVAALRGAARTDFQVNIFF